MRSNLGDLSLQIKIKTIFKIKLFLSDIGRQWGALAGKDILVLPFR